MSRSNSPEKSFPSIRVGPKRVRIRFAIRNLPWLTLSLCAAMVSLAYFPECVGSLDLNRDAFMKGEVWRLITGHFVHYSSTHLFWDLIMFLLLGWMLEKEGTLRLALLLLGTCLVVSFLYLVFPPEDSIALSGASALDSALLSALYVSTWRDFKSSKILKYLVVALFLTFWVKITLEFFLEEALFSVVPGDARIYPAAHIAGALFGISFFLVANFKKGSKRIPLSLEPKGQKQDNS